MSATDPSLKWEPSLIGVMWEPSLIPVDPPVGRGSVGCRNGTTTLMGGI